MYELEQNLNWNLEKVYQWLFKDKLALSKDKIEHIMSSSSHSLEELKRNLNRNLEKVHQWFLTDKLTLNKKKIEYIIIELRQKKF